MKRDPEKLRWRRTPVRHSEDRDIIIASRSISFPRWVYCQITSDNPVKGAKPRIRFADGYGRSNRTARVNAKLNLQGGISASWDNPSIVGSGAANAAGSVTMSTNFVVTI